MDQRNGGNSADGVIPIADLWEDVLHLLTLTMDYPAALS